MNVKLRDEYVFIIEEIRKVSLQPLPETSDSGVHAAVTAAAAVAADATAAAAAATAELDKLRSEMESLRLSAAASAAAAAAANEARAEMEGESIHLNSLHFFPSFPFPRPLPPHFPRQNRFGSRAHSSRSSPSTVTSSHNLSRRLFRWRCRRPAPPLHFSHPSSSCRVKLYFFRTSMYAASLPHRFLPPNHRMYRESLAHAIVQHCCRCSRSPISQSLASFSSLFLAQSTACVTAHFLKHSLRVVPCDRLSRRSPPSCTASPSPSPFAPTATCAACTRSHLAYFEHHHRFA
jgi:hypothetical protein